MKWSIPHYAYKLRSMISFESVSKHLAKTKLLQQTRLCLQLLPHLAHVTFLELDIPQLVVCLLFLVTAPKLP